MDYFGKRDLIYIDMQGDADVSRIHTTALAQANGEEWREEWEKIMII